jgi:hypothetical protein
VLASLREKQISGEKREAGVSFGRMPTAGNDGLQLVVVYICHAGLRAAITYRPGSCGNPLTKGTETTFAGVGTFCTSSATRVPFRGLAT